MLKIDLIFLTLAAACLVCGVTMGIAMGLSRDFAFAPVHAHTNLVGWTSLALFGLAYRAYPALQLGVLARVHLVLSGAGGPLFLIGMYVAFVHHQITPALIGAIMWLLGAVLFLARLLWLNFAKDQAAQQAVA